MAFTKVHAKLLAEMMSTDELAAFRFICGKSETGSIATAEVIEGLVELELVRGATDGKRNLVLLTSRGKKVAEVV